MKRKSVIALTFVLALAVGAFLLLAGVPPAQAQQGCTAFHGIVQGTLPTSTPLVPATDVWGGPVHASLGGEILIGSMSGNDGTPAGQGPVANFRDGMYKVCFGNSAGCFTYEVPHAVVLWPVADRLGNYKGIANIVEGQGTGRFASASGHLDIAGSFILWPDANSPFGVSGRWNGEFSGKICGVAQ